MRNNPKPFRLSVEDMKDFRISFDIMVKHDVASTSHWKEHPAVLAMVTMLNAKDILDLFEEVIKNEPAVETNMKELRDWRDLAKSPSSDYETRNVNRKKIRDYLDENIGFECGNEPYQLYYIYSYQYRGVNLNQPLDVKPDHPSFALFFGFRLSKTHFPNEFLAFHFNTTYNGDVNAFRLLLAELDKSMLGPRIDFLAEWKEINLKSRSTLPTRSRTKNTTKSKISEKAKSVKLNNYFKNSEKATSVMTEFCQTKSKTRVVTAAKTLRSFISKKYDEVLKAPSLCALLIEIGIISETDFENYSQYLKASKLRETPENQTLLTSLSKVD